MLYGWTDEPRTRNQNLAKLTMTFWRVSIGSPFRVAGKNVYFQTAASAF